MAEERQMNKSPFGTAVSSALVRHVSAEGCQLMFESQDVAEGSRFLVVVPGSECSVMGTVRWVVGPRAGFAFDEAISHDLRAKLESEHPLPTPVLLHSR